MHLSDDSISTPRSSTNLFILAAFCVGQAVAVNNGVIHPIALAWIGVGLVALLSAITGVQIRLFSRLERLPIRSMLLACIAVQWTQSMWWAVRWGPSGSEAWLVASLALAGAGIALTAHVEQYEDFGFLLLLAGFALCAGGLIHASPTIGIDVLHFQEESSIAVLRGENPYAVRYLDVYYPNVGFYSDDATANGWLTYSYPYPPLMLALAVPAKALMGDIRYGHVAAMVLSAMFIVAYRRSRTTMLLAAMMLLLPRNLLTLQVAWTEPMVLLCLSMMIFAVGRKLPLAWVAVGALLAIKQYAVLFVPILPLLHSGRITLGGIVKRYWKPAAFAALTIVPFLIWSPTSFVRSVALWQLRQPFREDALSYTTLFWHMTGITLGAGPGFIAAAVGVWIAWKWVPRNVNGFTAATTLVLLAFFAFNKQAFCNYYTLVAAAGCWCATLAHAAAAEAADADTRDTDATLSMTPWASVRPAA